MGKSHDAGVEIHPGIHLAPAHVSDRVIDVFEPNGFNGYSRIPRLITREEHAAVLLALHEYVDGVAVGLDGAQHHPAVRVLADLRFKNTHGTARGGFCVALGGVVHPKRHRFHAVAVPVDVVVDGPAGLQRRGQHQVDFILAQHV